MINTYFLVLLVWSLSGTLRQRVFFSIIFTLYVLIYLAIDVVSANGINLAALYHLDTNITGSSLGGYALYFVFVILGVVLACVCGLLVSRKVSPKLNGKVFAVSLLALFILSQPTLDMVKLGQEFYSVSSMPDPVDMYVDQQDLKIQPQKDVVIISVESLNNSIWKKFSRMTTGVTGVSFDDVKQLPGTGWTIGGLTAANCGLPLGLGTGNSRQPYIYPSHSCLTDILANSGYKVVAVQGTDGRFANQEKLYLGHSVKPENFIDKRKIRISERPSSWAGSYHDREVIDVARKRLNSHIEENSNDPIALFVNTIDTHAPEGYPNESCRSYYSAVEDTLEQSYRCTIDDITGFIRYLQSTQRDMIIVVHSDHLLMKNETHLTGKQEMEKNTFVVFNVNSDHKNKGIVNNLHPGSTLDIAPTILDILSDGRITRLGFGYSLMRRPPLDIGWRDYIPYEYADFLKKKQSFPKLQTILPVGSGDMLIANGGIEISLPFAYLSSTEEYVFSDGNENGYSHLNSLSTVLKNVGDKEGVIFAACSSLDNYEADSGACALSKTGEGIVAAVRINSETTLDMMRGKLMLPRNSLEIVNLSKRSFWDSFVVSTYSTLRAYLPVEYIQNLKNAYVRFGFYVFQLKNSLSGEVEFEEHDAQYDIAHGGGSIDGFLYTNSLEAVQKSLEMGLNKVELDLQISSDGHIVAVHDWPSWSKMTGCSSVKVPTLEEFRRCKLHGKYTPIDAGVINELMDQHENLILVTDKLNAPLDVIKQIRHSSRVMMELFTERAIYEANELGIKVLVSGELLKSDYSLSLEIPSWFDQVAGVAADRHLIMRFPQEFYSFKKQGKKVYAFSVNDGKYRGREKEVWCDLRDFITGMYADFPLSYETVNCL
jgi:hypothetical protein